MFEIRITDNSVIESGELRLNERKKTTLSVALWTLFEANSSLVQTIMIRPPIKSTNRYKLRISNG